MACNHWSFSVFFRKNDQYASPEQDRQKKSAFRLLKSTFPFMRSFKYDPSREAQCRGGGGDGVFRKIVGINEFEEASGDDLDEDVLVVILIEDDAALVNALTVELFGRCL